MKIFFLMCLSAVALFTYMSAHAQSYPCSGASVGEVVVGQTGASNGIASVPLCQHADSSDASSSAQPQYRWKSRWGAIVTDGIAGALGTSTNMTNQRSAEEVAFQDCQKKGGKQCKLDASYANACGAMVVGDRGFSVNTGANKNEAISNATNSCNGKDQNCHVYYVDCSAPVLAR